MKTILVLENNIKLNYTLSYELKKDSYKVVSAYSIDEAMELYRDYEIDLAIIEADLPNEEAVLFYKWLYKQHTVPVLFLTEEPSQELALKALGLTQEEYLTRPFSMAVFIKKVEFICLREATSDWHLFDDGFLVVDFDTAKVSVGGLNCPVTPTEFRLLKYLIGHQGQLLSYETLLAFLWDTGAQFVDKHGLAVNINRLRNKIADQDHHYITNVFGQGYLWEKYGQITPLDLS